MAANVRGMGPRSLVACCVALLTGATVLAPFASAQTRRACNARVVQRGQWTSITPPAFPSGGRALVDFDLNQLYGIVTNGTSVLRSVEACRFEPSFSLDPTPTIERPYTSSNARIEQVLVQPAVLGGAAFLMIQEGPDAAARPHVVKSAEAGAQWSSADVGLPPAGDPIFLRAAPSDPRVLYLGIREGAGALDLLYASDNGGDTWLLRSDLTGLQLQPEIEDVRVDPMDANVLWAWGGTGLYRSQDGGRSFHKVEQDELSQGPVGPADVFHAPGSPARVLVFDRQPKQALLSDAGGANGSWTTITAPPGDIDAIDHGADRNQMFVTAGGDAWLYNPPTFSWIDLRAPADGLRDVTSTDAPTPWFVARTERTLEAYVPPPPGQYEPPIPDYKLDIPRLIDPRDEPPGQSALTGPTRVAIDAADTKTVAYELALPKVAVPLDVYLLVDTSGSMGRAIGGLHEALAGILNGLAAKRIDLWAGLAEYRGYPDRFPPKPRCAETPGSIPTSDCESNFVYRQVIDMGPIDPAMMGEEIARLNASGGGVYDAMLGALYQTATGEGQDLYPPGPAGHDVPSGHAATFRKKALKVVLHVADERFVQASGEPRGFTTDKPPQDPDIPSYEEAIGALNEADALQVGLAVGPLARPGLERVARGTRALAPAGGVDCDGDRRPELTEGDPLVCQVRPSQVGEARFLVPAIVDLLRAVTTRDSVTLEAASAKPVVAEVTPGSYDGVVLQADNVLDFEVTYRCPLTLAGERADVKLDAVGGRAELASASVRVVCRDVFDRRKETLEEVPPAPLAPLAAAIGVGIPAPPPPPPPPPVPELASASQSQAQSQAQAQGAAALQEEEQPQMAFVAAFEATREQMGEEYAMTSYRERSSSVPAEALWGLGAVAISFAGGWLALARQRVRIRRVRS